MQLPFSQAEFLGVFAAYNRAIWPLQPIAAALGLFAMGLLYYRPRWADRAISAVLATFWLAMGVGYHIAFFAAINRAAYAFGALFLAAAALFLVEGVIRDQIRFDDRSAIRLWPAIAMLGYGFLFYPLWGLAAANPYPETPLFGVAPCPTTIFTLAFLLVARHPSPYILAAIPLLWSLVGGSAAFLLSNPEDWGLIVAACGWVAVTMICRTRRPD